MDPHRILVVDDEAPARKKARRLLSARQDVSVIGEASNGQEAIAAIRALEPDIVLLDIQMPRGTGFDVVAAVKDTPLAFIFATAYDQHALEAFDVSAVDYLLKPFSSERLNRALDRAIERGGTAGTNTGAEHLLRLLQQAGLSDTPYPKRITVDARGRKIVLDLEDVTHLIAEKNYVGVWAAGREYLVRQTLSSFEDTLDPNAFARIHRSAIVNVGHVSEIIGGGHGDRTLVLSDGSSVRMSRTYRDQFERRIRNL